MVRPSYSVAAGSFPAADAKNGVDEMNQTREMTLERTLPYLDREITKMIKGIALVMMFVHHFFTFPD